VHSLIHLAAECLHNRPLDTFSTFKYESYLKDIRNTLQSGYSPLQQLANRYTETGGHLIKPKTTQDPGAVKLSCPHEIDEDIEGTQYKKVELKKITLALRDADSCFVTKTKAVVVLENIVCTPDDKIVLVGRKFLQSNDYYSFPIKSSDLGILKVSNLELEKSFFDIQEFSQKMYLIRGRRSHLAIPLVHSIWDLDDD